MNRRFVSRPRPLLCLALLPLAFAASAQTYTQTEEIVYYDNTANWVLGQVKQRKIDGTVVASSTFDANTARPLTQSSFAKLQQTLTWNADGTVATVKDGNNNVTAVGNWKRGIPQTIVHADGSSQSATVNDLGWITSVTDETDAKTCYGHDAMGRINRITYPSESAADTCNASAWNETVLAFEQVTGAEYGIQGDHWRQTIITGNGRKIVYFDALWRPLLTREYDTADATATQRFQRFAYDQGGRTAFASYPGATDALTAGIWTGYDALGRITSVAQDSELSAGLLVTTTEYLDGFRTRVTNPHGHATTTYYKVYDQPNTDWPMAIEQPEGATTVFERDTYGKPSSITRYDAADPIVSATRKYVYRPLDQSLCKVIEPETGATVMEYDGANNLIWSASGLDLPDTTRCNGGPLSHGSGRRVDRTYDARNRLTSIVFPDHRGDTTYSYTPDGLLGSVTADNGGADQVTTQYTYNRRRLMITERLLWGNVNTNWPISYSYDANGHLNSQHSHVLALDYAPNALGQPTKAGSYVDNVSYYPNGAIRQFTYGNGIVHTLIQNDRQLPERSRDVYGSTVFLDDSYDYDKNGNVAGISDALPEHRGDRTMTYDDLDRLAATVSPMFGTATYAYDALDNLTRVKLTGGNQVRDHYYCYDSRWRLTNVKTGGCSGSTVIGLGYDVQGNLDNKSGQTFDFDYGNRLRWASGSPASSYVYDGHGRRVRDYAGASKYSQYNHAGQLIFANDVRSNKFLDYVYLGGSLVAVHERNRTTGAATTKYLHTDALGSPVAVTSQGRTVLERREYEPYGRQLRPTAPVDGPGFTGHVLDAATGLNYMQQRYYDPGIGRFLSVDPVSATSVGGNFNRYKYAANNPYRFVDPDGRIDWEKLGDAFQIEGGFQLGLGAKVKAGPLKVHATTGHIGFFGGFTFAPDSYAVEEVSRPSAALEIGSYGIGYQGSATREFQGRSGKLWSEEHVKGGGIFGRKRTELKVEDGGTNGELSVSVNPVFLHLSGSIDFGKVIEAFKSAPGVSNVSSDATSGTAKIRMEPKIGTRISRTHTVCVDSSKCGK